jgi:hypothetical protein
VSNALKEKPRIVENIEELHRQASDACIIRVSASTVSIVNSIRTVGHDPITNKRGDGEDTGTGCAGHWGNHHFVLTAEHVLNANAKPSDLRIFWRPTAGIERIADADLKPKDIGDAVAIRDRDAIIHRCNWEDIAIIAMDPAEAGPHTEFVDIAKDWADPAENEEVYCCGFPIDKNVLVGRRVVGKKEERDIALRPEMFSGPVLPRPTEQELKFQITAYNPDRHYLVPYTHPVSKHPLGFSGAAMWWESDEKQLIWKPNFKFAGICTCCYKKGTVEQVVKASVVRQFLEEVFGPA